MYIHVQYLLNYGADVHERAIGGFFCADDQKRDRLDTLDHEHYILPYELFQLQNSFSSF